MEKNLLTAFQRVTAITDEKINRLMDGVESLPNIPPVPGMDLTAGGEVLTHQEFLRLKTVHSEFAQEKEALKTAFTGVNALVMNKQVFYKLTRQLELFRIYKAPNDKYTISFDGLPETSKAEIKRVVDEQAATQWRQKGLLGYAEAVFNFGERYGNGFLIGAGVLFLLLWGIVGNVWAALGITGVLFMLLGYQLSHTKPDPEQPKQDNIRALLFPDYVIKTQPSERHGNYLSMSVKVVDPPADTATTIRSVLNEVQKAIQGKGEFCVVADPKAVAINDIKFFTVPLPPPPVFLSDPGLVVEYKHFAVILTDTFYYVSDLEQHFLDAAVKVAEQWDAKRYLFN